MKKYESLAIDWADENCPCSKDCDAECEASALRKGFTAGFEAAREMAVKFFADAYRDPRYVGMCIQSALDQMADDLRSMGDAPDVSEE